MKRLKYLFTGLILCSALYQANAQQYQWVKGSSAAIVARKTIKDKEGRNYIIGTFSGNADFNFSNAATDTAYLRATASAMFFAAYDTGGTYRWARRIEGIDPVDAATDNAGNLYITGTFKGAADFNPSDAAADTAIERSNYYTDLLDHTPSVYIAKFDTAGRFVWVKNISGLEQGVSNMVVKNNRIYISGFTNTYPAAYGIFPNRTDFNPSQTTADTFFLDKGPEEVQNPFIAVYDLTGTLDTAFKIAAPWNFNGKGIEVDQSGCIYASGELRGRTDFNLSDNAADTFFLDAPRSNYLAKYDSLGRFVWAVPVISGDNLNSGQGGNTLLKLTTSGHCYVSSVFSGSADFNPGSAAADTLNLRTAAVEASYLSHYDTAGRFVNAFTLGDPLSYINALATDDSGNLYLAGEFTGTADFNLQRGAGDTLNLRSAGANSNADIFFAKYRNDTLVWAQKVGNAERQAASSIAVGNKAVTLFGNFGGDVIFDPMPPANMASQLTGGGVYLATYRTTPPGSAKQLLTYSFTTPLATGVITATDSVLVTVPAATNVNNLIANFTLSPLAIAKVGTVLQVSGTTPNNFTTVVTYTIIAEDNSTKDYIVKVTVEEPPVGIDEISRESASFKVWPNPASDVLRFETSVDVTLYDLQGRPVLSATNVKELSVGHLAAGIYLLQNGQGQQRKIRIR